MHMTPAPNDELSTLRAEIATLRAQLQQVHADPERVAPQQ
jgi:hypothetical protein